MRNLKKIRKLRNITIKELASALNLAESTISLYENGRREPDFDTLSKISDFFNVSIDYLLGKEDIDSKPKGIKIPVLGTINAGLPIEAVENIIDYEEISQSMASHGEYFALKIKGDSMIPTVKEGDIVIIRKQEDTDSGKICVVMVNGYDATLKEIKKESNGLWVLPHNPNSDFKPTFYSTEEVSKLPVRILGVAVEIRRSL